MDTASIQNLWLWVLFLLDKNKGNRGHDILFVWGHYLPRARDQRFINTNISTYPFKFICPRGLVQDHSTKFPVYNFSNLSTANKY